VKADKMRAKRESENECRKGIKTKITGFKTRKQKEQM
jgi:hypothetical protein